MVAKKGPEITHHFAHLSSRDCAHAFETALHLAAKRVLETHKKMRIPDVKVGFNSYKKPWVISEERDIYFEAVSVERKLGNVVPDLLVHVERKRLAIEIAVTHFVDSLKLKKLSDLRISTLEIDLAELSRTPTLKALEQQIVFSVRSKRWLYNVFFVLPYEYPSNIQAIRVFHRLGVITRCHLCCILRSKAAVALQHGVIGAANFVEEGHRRLLLSALGCEVGEVRWW